MEEILELFYPLRNDWTNLKILNFSFKVIPKKRDFFHVNQIIPSRIETYWSQLVEKDHLVGSLLKLLWWLSWLGAVSSAEKGENFLNYWGDRVFSSAGQVGFYILSEKSIDWKYQTISVIFEKKSHTVPWYHFIFIKFWKFLNHSILVTVRLTI